MDYIIKLLPLVILSIPICISSYYAYKTSKAYITYLEKEDQTRSKLLQLLKELEDKLNNI